MLTWIKCRGTLFILKEHVKRAEQQAQALEQQWQLEEQYLIVKRRFPLCPHCGVDSQVIYCERLTDRTEAFHCVNCKKEVSL